MRGEFKVTRWEGESNEQIYEIFGMSMYADGVVSC